MEMNAYYEGYLDNAQDTLGNMMDYAVHSCGIAAEKIFEMFLISGAAKQFERGNPRYIAGMSGAELASEAVLKVTGKQLEEPEEYDMTKSPEYWCGWILAYYQWRTGRSFQKIHQVVSIDEILCMYPTHHEADEERFVETMEYIYQKRHTKSYLQQMRENIGMGTDELSEQTGVPKQVIEGLEMDFTKINATDTITVFHLSRVLGCSMEMLMEI